MDPNEAASLTATAAAVQAGAAIAVLLVTIGLGIIAAKALAASDRQAAAAAGAIDEMKLQRDEMARQRDEIAKQREEQRRQFVLSSLPFLRVRAPQGEIGDIGNELRLVTYLQIENAGPVPALGVRVEFRGVSTDEVVGTHVYTRGALSMIVPGEDSRLAVDSHELWNVKMDSEKSQALQAAGEPPGFFHAEKLLLSFSFRSPLGAVVRQEYRWLPNALNRTPAEQVWRLQRVAVTADPSRPDEAIVVDLTTSADA